MASQSAMPGLPEKRVDRKALADQWRTRIAELARVFGLDPKTAIRYAENARALLVTAAEQQDPAGPREPKGQNHP